MPSSFAARITRMAISPRLAMRRLRIRVMSMKYRTTCVGGGRRLDNSENGRRDAMQTRAAACRDCRTVAHPQPGMRTMRHPAGPDSASPRQRVARLGREISMHSIAIHGGAGTLPRSEMTPELEGQYRADLQKALDAGYQLLADGKTSMDAVTAAVRVLEDSPLFNAGKGAVFNREAQVELDAAVMDGATLKAGAVAGVRHIRNPVELA